MSRRNDTAPASAQSRVVDELLEGVDDPQPILAADRGTPTIAAISAALFSAATAACIVATAVMVFFVSDILAQDGLSWAALPLLAMGLVPLIAFLGFEALSRMSLVSFGSARMEVRRKVWAACGALGLMGVAALHLWMAIGVLAGMSLGVCLVYAASRLPPEKSWAYRPDEAASMLAGRDGAGLAAAQGGAIPRETVQVAIWGASWVTCLAGAASAAALVGQGVLSEAAIVPICCFLLWAAHAVLSGVAADPGSETFIAASAQVFHLQRARDESKDGDECAQGLDVTGLSVQTQTGDLLTDVAFTMAPGEIVGIVGDAGAGKSVLARSIVDPWSNEGCRIEGRITLAGTDLWERSATTRGIPAVLLPEAPVLLPTSGLDNLCAFDDPKASEQAKRCLKSLVFSEDAVARITGCDDARKLSTADAKVLSFARAFLMAPSLYILDRPEDGCSAALLLALKQRLLLESRAGRGVLLVTEDRGLLDICGRLLSLEEGKLTDDAPASEMRARRSTGWARFVAERRIESEETLTAWVRSQFKRDGDDENRRRTCGVAAEMLALSCGDHPASGAERITFDFKHFEAFALMRIQDLGELISSGRLQEATRHAQSEAASTRLSPLARVLGAVESFEQDHVDGRRILTVKIATTDPRKQAAPRKEKRHGAA